jgi:chemotaxis protein methyltransferase CheR
MEMTTDSETIEIELLVEAIYKKYGYDFRNYSRASLHRRIKNKFRNSGLENLSAMQHRLLYERPFFESVLLDLTINVTEMFRDPTFYCALREKVLPVLKTYPFFKIWHAGCSTGEEVYSMAILLKEANLLQNAMIYATDIDEKVLKTAREGIYRLEKIKEYTQNYQKACGDASFSDYYTAKYEAAIIDKSLKKNIVFSQHNLVTDGVFGEMNLIICRNVIIYFDKELQNRVLKLFHDSLVRRGILCLGSKETVQFTTLNTAFQEYDGKEKIFKRVS